MASGKIESLGARFAVLEGTLSSSDGWSSYVALPTGWSWGDTVILGIEVQDDSNYWRLGQGTDGATFKRTFAQMGSNGVRAYNNSSTYYRKKYRVTVANIL